MTRDSYQAGFDRMPVLSVTSFLAMQKPPVRFDQFDQLTNLDGAHRIYESYYVTLPIKPCPVRSLGMAKTDREFAGRRVRGGRGVAAMVEGWAPS